MKNTKPDFKAIKQEILADESAAKRSKLSKGVLAAAAVATPAAIFSAGSASAQSIDYGSLEMLFGEPVTTSATGAPQRASETPATMEIISAEDIKASGANDLTTVLSRVVGINHNRYGQAQADVAVRGYVQSANPRLLVLVNGRQVYFDFYGYTVWETIPVQLEEIRQIEVVKGPNTALFGFNAVGGVVNIITYDPILDDKDNVTLSVNADGGSDASAVMTVKPSDKLGIRASLGGFNANEWDIDNEFRNEPENNGLTYAAEVAYQVTDKVTASAEVTHGDVKRAERYASGGFPYTKTETDSMLGRVEAEGSFGLLKVTAYENKDKLTGFTEAGYDFDIDAKLQVFQAEDLFKVGAKHTFRVAAEYRKADAVLTAVSGNTYPAETTVTSGSAMWNWAITDKLTSTVAARYDSMEYEGDSVAAQFGYGLRSEGELEEPSWNVGLVFKATDYDTFNFQIARGLQIPAILDYVFAGTGTIAPPVVDNYAIDYDRSIPSISGHFRASVFYQTNEDIKYLHNFGLLPGVTLPNVLTIGDSELSGLELSLDGVASDNLSWYVNYAYLNLEDDIGTVPSYGGVLNIQPISYESSTPEHEVKAGLRYERGKWTFGADARYTSDVEYYSAPLETGGFLYAPVPLDAYVALDARIGYEVSEGVHLSVEGENLSNDGDPQIAGGAIESIYRMKLSVDF